MEILYVGSPLLEKVARHGGHLQSEEVLDLSGEDGHGNTAGETHHDGVRYKLDDGAQAEYAQQDEEHTGQHSGYHQARQTQIGVVDNAVDDDDEGTCGTTYLHLAAAQSAHDETADDGCEDVL